MNIPIPTPIYRIIHIDNLPILLSRGGLHAPNSQPNDGLSYKKIHNVSIQSERRIARIYCGPCGVIHDYVSFYFGRLSPMLFQLHTGWVTDYHEGQEPIIYLVSNVQQVVESGSKFVFSDGHGIARFTSWFESIDDLDKIDWNVVYLKMWKDCIEDMDRKRRKQAEFLVYDFCDWDLINEIAVIDTMMKDKVETIFGGFDISLRKDVHIHTDWYY